MFGSSLVAIDALSLAKIEGRRPDTLHVSTGGGPALATDAALSTLARGLDAELVAVTDNNAQGEAFSARLRSIANAAGCDCERLSPSADDWNDALQRQAKYV